MISNQ